MRRRTRRSGAASAVSAMPGVMRLGRPGVHLITLLLAVLSLWSLVGFVGQVIGSAQMERQKEELRAENARLTAENAQLQDRVAEAKSPDYADRIAREQLGYARAGDTVILPTLPQPTAAPANLSPPTPPARAPDPNWRRWVNAFFPPAETP
jgi:cell division protein FtsB